MKDKWISIKDRLPDSMIDVLVCVLYETLNECHYLTAYYNEIKKEWRMDDFLLEDEAESTLVDGKIITHWIPLPKGPNER